MISPFYRGNTKIYRFRFTAPNPAWVCVEPVSIVTSVKGICDTVSYPIDDGPTVDDEGNAVSSIVEAITDDWTLTFTSATDYTCAGIIEGNVGAGNITTDFAPDIKDAVDGSCDTLFILPKEAWGGTFVAGDTVTFSTVAREVVVDITDYEITLTFIVDAEAGDDPTVQFTDTAGDNILDDVANGLMFVTLVSGESAKLVEDRYEYGFERRIPDISLDTTLDLVATLDSGKVNILTPAKEVPVIP